MKVLIIEDAELPLKFMTEVLSGLGHTVHAAEWIEQARELLAAGDYELVLLDHRLPMSQGGEAESIGYGLVGEIQQTNPRAVIVGTSSLTEKEVQWSGFELPSRTMNKTDPWEEIPKILKEMK